MFILELFQSRLIAGFLHRWWLVGIDKFDQGVDLTRVIALVVVRLNDGAMGVGLVLMWTALTCKKIF
ncbi:hypothetical protein ACQXZL_08590 [Corynebacterium diphtheriae]|uniref:Uncharacterized protein n=1 Tax=Corynebacterium diphtheriae TaxID=1717 RepID=A0A811G1X5_CORDP|nr:hypothetical protein [Corynebacterium diphtheriae]OSQ22947.1 hypothetical protein B1A51_05105 [Corynebacterium diphtheriae]RKW81089.1 hypothetical protein D9B42_02525 [Corynebacterium diphtheriae]RKW86171.1 hypothetical protein D9D07_02640 [Corynebacterium diphtheriae]RKW90756.1 hypothetical protein D9B87_02335 [Corynebacterium diphtheriae]RKW96462.1 hypothetical protein D9B51_02470 [Corynebacterium diphtheriae]